VLQQDDLGSFGGFVVEEVGLELVRGGGCLQDQGEQFGSAVVNGSHSGRSPSSHVGLEVLDLAQGDEYFW